MGRRNKVDWGSTPNAHRHAKRTEFTLTDEEREILARFGGERDKSAVVGAALAALLRLPGDEILSLIAEARAKRKNRANTP
jgi:hypothetical protein